MKLTASFLRRLACVAGVAFIPTASAESGASPAFSPGAIFEDLEADGYGLFSGKLQSLLMHRDIEGAGHGNSGTLAATLNYRSPEWGGLFVGGQGIYSWRVFEDGDRRAGGPAYWLSNDEFSVLNEAYAGFNFESVGWEGAELRVGRQILNYDFAPTYNIRQKDQSYEGVVLKTQPRDNLTLDLGWFDRFSSWASREGGPSTWRAEFIDVEDRVGVPYDTNGFFFASAVYTPCDAFSLGAYDFYGDDLFNVFGLKGAYTWELGGDCGSLTFRGHWANQRDVGRMNRDGLGDIGSNVIEAGLDYALGGLTLSGGGVFIRGDDFQTPFRTSFTIDTELLWYTMQFEGGTNSGYLKGVWKWEDWMFYAMYVASEHRCGRVCQEIDVVVKRTFDAGLYTAVKAGYGGRRPGTLTAGPKTNALDLRWFFGWTF
ncbi:OprD family outer membrane porin [Haloferula sp. A504]|uniref:OprD family outer membrane porin n=1 Tax=Haloferula sp. A504 TaxID=3373601 RepID=UPI0031C6EF7B|nr:OprD family outer membrane porin [Verrucomicrobiaceae bacterium E54]